MKRGLTKGILLSIFLLVFLSSGIFAAAPASGTCAITLRNECVEADGNYILMGLTSSTNAHAQIIEQTPEYAYVLCCALGIGDRTCIGTTNKIIGLSSTTNAHAEKPSLTTYTVPVCYEDFSCASTTASSCPDGTVGILSLTADTNAHIGNSTDYPVKICCQSSFLPYSCSFESASWGTTTVYNGATVYLDIVGSGAKCDGESIAFDVYKKNLIGADDPAVCDASTDINGNCNLNIAFGEDNKAVGSWTAEYPKGAIGDLEYYFNVSRVKNKGISLISSDPKLIVKYRNIEENVCPDVLTCEDYSSQTDCESDVGLCKVGGNSNLLEVDCSADNIICGCSWDAATSQCGFGYTEIEQESCGTPATGCEFGCSLCNTTTAPSTTYCGLGSTCEGGIIATNNNASCDFGIDGCASADCNNGDKDTCASGLYCLADKCSSIEGPPLSLGSCKITQNIDKDCETPPVGFRTITWTGIWSKEPEPGKPAYERCIAGGTTTIPCPAQIQLPFFDYYELILTVVVIALIYVSLIFRRKFGKKSKVKGKK